MSTHEVDRVHTTLEDDDGRAQTMRHRCPECGEQNRILPPLGHRLVPSGERRMAEADAPARVFERLYYRGDQPRPANESRSAGADDPARVFERLYYGG